MERRFGHRTPVAADVVIYANGLPMAVGRARNVSLLGAYLEMPADTLRKHRIIELEFTATDPEGRSKYCRIPAMVARQADGGLGLIFETSDPVTRKTVQELIHDQRRRAQAQGSLVS